ncbi:MAG: ABC transporter permease, partial [Proteobacteria bacterium]|nr:ABC transporter permease [Pseudomonadota bacterium]
LSGMGGLEIIFKEMVPNLLPFLGAAFTGSVRGAIFDTIGLSALGLGPLREPELGVTIYWIISQNAMLRGLWWWPIMPVALILFVMITLYLLTAGFDEVANPRLQRN